MDYLSLFSGIGGFEYGIQQSNKNKHLTCIGFSEVDKYAKAIYTRHFPEHKNYGNATGIRTEDLPAFNLLVGGFPCQAFSFAGKRRGFDDTRGTLFFEIARILKDKRPRYFLLENVKGLLSHDKGQTFQTILRTLSKLGYDVQWEIFNSKNCGVPQNRERLYIKGFLTTKGGSSREVLSLRKAEKEIDVQSETELIQLHEKVDELQIERLGNLYGKWSQSGCVCGENGVSPTIVAYSHPTKVLIRNTPTKRYKLRKLTPIECERLQGFPDNWTQYGADDELISDTQRYKCCGNAVTTNVVTHIFNSWNMIFK